MVRDVCYERLGEEGMTRMNYRLMQLSTLR